jgi:hypothetical protein
MSWANEARAVVSPAYDDGVLSEADIQTFQARFARLHGAASS